jgi:hypothetical protein
LAPAFPICINEKCQNDRRTCERAGRDRIVVSTSRCGRDNPGSNPGHGIMVAVRLALPSSHTFLCPEILKYYLMSNFIMKSIKLSPI